MTATTSEFALELVLRNGPRPATVLNASYVAIPVRIWLSIKLIKPFLQIETVWNYTAMGVVISMENETRLR
jgi:hypothetical protein